MTNGFLQEYRAKRDPARTPEPFATRPAAQPDVGTTGGRFVIQQHAARRLHWDLRLEVDGVLASWAVPRGPSVDPKERRLAVRTEDHPLEYAEFEGLIPAGNYGAGAMIVWDRGTYHTVDDTAAAEGLRKGKLDLVISGHKLRGRWGLVRTKGETGKDWLLMKKADGQRSSPEPVTAQPASVLSGLTIDELGQGVRRTSDLAARAAAVGAVRRSLQAKTITPMLAETAPHPFSKPDWLFELKYDGVRILATRDADAHARLYYRTRRDTTELFPEIARAVAHLPCDQFIIDGEIIATNERGASSFERLQKRLALSDPLAIARAEVETPVAMLCFDLLAVAGYDLRSLPLFQRKELLRILVPQVGVLRYSEHFERDGEALFEAASELGLEGIVAKRAASPYRSGQRSRDWLKIKATQTADVAIVGYVRGKGSRSRLGSLMMGWYQDGELLYAGNVGTGLSPTTIDDLLPQLEAAQRPTAAFRGTPPGPARANLFVEPKLVAEVRYAEVTRSGLLRQPVFIRLRNDKAVGDCQAPVARPAPIEPASPPAAPAPELRLSNLDKVFFPQDGYTKGDLLQYYEQVWPWIAPYLRDRPVVLTRYPDGIDGKNFFQKNAPDFTPEWAETCQIEDNDYFICNDVRTLLYVINSGCIPLHVWSARRDSLDRPDWTILDLDPKGAPFASVIAVARHIHALLGSLAVPDFVKTSGQDGLHILIPLGGSLTHSEARLFAEVLARVVAAELPEIATVARPLGARGGKVYIDFLQNGFGKTIAAPLSVRPRRGAPVSTPMSWDEIRPRLDPGRLTLRTVPARLRKRHDPMRGLLTTETDVQAALHALTKRMA